MNNKQGALPFLKHAVELEPHNSAAIQLLAQVYYDLGNQREAIETYKIAIAEEEDKKIKADLYFNLGGIFNQIGSFDEAEVAFDEAYYFNDQDFEAVVGMLKVQTRCSDFLGRMADDRLLAVAAQLDPVFTGIKQELEA